MNPSPDREPLTLIAPPAVDDRPPNQHETIKFDTLKKHSRKLMQAYLTLQAAKKKYATLLKELAGRTNADQSTLRKLIQHSADGTYTDYRNLLDRSVIVFEQVGQVPTASEPPELTEASE